MRAKAGPWCMDCRWLVLRVPADGSGAYWCEATSSPIEGAVAWRRACDRYAARITAGRP